MSGWGYLDSDSPSATALIPAFGGVALLICNPGVRRENKVAAHIAVLLTLIILLGLFQPLTGVVARGNISGIIRVALMLMSTMAAMVFFVRNFVRARQNK